MIWDRNQPQAPPQYPMNYQNPYMPPRPTFPSQQVPGTSTNSSGLPNLSNLSMKNIQALIDKMGGIDGLVKMAGDIQKLYQSAQPIINLMSALLAKPSAIQSESTTAADAPVKKPKRKKRTGKSKNQGAARRKRRKG